MRRSSTERPRYLLVLLVLLTACGAQEALAQFATGTNTRLVNVIEISDHEDPDHEDVVRESDQAEPENTEVPDAILD